MSLQRCFTPSSGVTASSKPWPPPRSTTKWRRRSEAMRLSHADRIWLGVSQYCMERRDHLRALADRRGDALYRCRSHVADGENTAPRRLQCMATTAGIFAGEDEPLGIEPDSRSAKPAGFWFSADEQKQMLDLATHFVTVRPAPPAHNFQHILTALEPADGGAGHHVDIGEAADALDQITRHRCREVRSAHQHPHPRALACQIDGALAGGIAGADQRNLLTGTEPRFQRRRPIVNA